MPDSHHNRGPRDVAIVAFAHAEHSPATPGTTNGVEMLVPVFAECFQQCGLDRTQIDFWCSGSSDYLAGRAFSFISALDAIGAVPPVMESHVEADAAWALYEAWLTIQAGHADTALVYGFGKASAAADLDAVLALQLDPYTVAPLAPGAAHLAALQAQAGIDAGAWTADDIAAVSERIHGSGVTAEDAALVAPPLRVADCPPVTDGACAVIIAAREALTDTMDKRAFISGMGHSMDSGLVGARDLTSSASVKHAAYLAGLGATNVEAINVAELHTPYAHQELIVKRELGLGASTRITPSGGAQGGNPLFSAGLERIGYAARAIWDGEAELALGHATNGQLLQQNLIAVLEGQVDTDAP